LAELCIALYEFLPTDSRFLGSSVSHGLRWSDLDTLTANSDDPLLRCKVIHDKSGREQCLSISTTRGFYLRYELRTRYVTNLVDLVVSGNRRERERMSYESVS
jgi:hypothetical protein